MEMDEHLYTPTVPTPWKQPRFPNEQETELRRRNKGEERETNKMQLIWCLLSNFYLNMFRAPLCPSSGEQDCVLPHMVFCTGCAGCGFVELGRELASQLHTTTASTTSAEHHMR